MKVAIVGGGQLARMLALAGTRLGMEFSFLLDTKDSSETSCIEGLGAIASINQDADGRALYESLGCPDLATFEKEQIDVRVLEALNQFCPTYPSPAAFNVCSYRQRQKQLLNQLCIPTAPFVYWSSGDVLPDGVDKLRFPLFAKSTHNAYDGRNQFILHNRQQLQDFCERNVSGSWIFEEQVHFEHEVSMIAARSVTGEMVFYSAVENHHRDGVLIYSISPAPSISDRDQRCLVEYAQSIFSALDYVGILAIECFVTENGLVVNELAPRVHNSGHWTSTGSITCQFENHLRAIAGLPLGSVDTTGYTAMVNLLGIESPPLDLLNSRNSLHWYKKVSRPGRKVGHINLHSDSLEEIYADVSQLVDDTRIAVAS